MGALLRFRGAEPRSPAAEFQQFGYLKQLYFSARHVKPFQNVTLAMIVETFEM